MKPISSLVGMPVLLRGKHMGRVARALLTSGGDKLAGLVVDTGLRGRRYVEEQHITLLGDVAVLVETQGTRGDGGPEPPLRRALSTSGERLGYVADAMLNEHTHEIVALSVSKGYIDELFGGRQLAERFTINQQTGDVVIAEASGAETGTMEAAGAIGTMETIGTMEKEE